MLGSVLLYAAGAVLRLWILKTPSLAATIQDRVEVSTPLNAWIRVQEGVFLQRHGVPVYSGGVFHETPLVLFLADIVTRWSEPWIHALFVLCDLTTAFLLSRVASAYARKLLLQQKSQVPSYACDAHPLLHRSAALAETVQHVATAYLLCPYTVLSCVALTTTTLHNLLLAAALLTMLTGHAVLFGCLVSLCTYQALYPVVVLVPGLIALHQHHVEGDARGGVSARAAAANTAVLRGLAAFVVTGALLLVISADLAGNWDFMEATYGFILSAPDLTPNIGLFWYFFTEMFEHFRLFFLAVFQLNALVYVAPLCVRLRGDPVLLSTSLLALSAVFRSYPALGDVGFYLALLPTCRHLYAFLRQSFLVGCMLVASSVLGPIMYNLWIYSGAANANFYFAVTLAFNTAQIFLVTDLLFGHVKRQHLLQHGSAMTIEGQPARLTLE